MPPIVLMGLCLLFTGCVTDDATTSRFGFTDASGASCSVEFPKEMDASEFEATLDARSGTATVKAKKIRTRNVETVRAQGQREKANLKAAGDLAGKLTESAVRGAVKGVVP